MLQRALGGGLGLKNAVFSAQRHAFSTATPLSTFQMPEEAPTPYPGPKRWPARNRVVHAPVKEGEKPPLVEYFHVRPNIHHSTKKFWLVCQFVNFSHFSKQIVSKQRFSLGPRHERRRGSQATDVHQQEERPDRQRRHRGSARDRLERAQFRIQVF